MDDDKNMQTQRTSKHPSEKHDGRRSNGKSGRSQAKSARSVSARRDDEGRFASRKSGRAGRFFRETGRGIEDYVSSNPLLFSVVGLAAGFVIGSLLPRTRREDMALGSFADDVREKGARYTHEIAARGREYLENALVGNERNAEAEPEDPEHSVKHH